MILFLIQYKNTNDGKKFFFNKFKGSTNGGSLGQRSKQVTE